VLVFLCAAVLTHVDFYCCYYHYNYVSILYHRLAKLKPVFAKDGVVTAGNR
jgi:hypothetical protein